MSKALVDSDVSYPLVALPLEPGIPSLLGSLLPGARYQYFEYGIYQRDLELMDEMLSHGTELVYSHDFKSPGGSYDMAAIFLPVSRPLIKFVLSHISPALKSGAKVVVVGANKSGIRSCRKMIEQYIGPLAGVRAESHSVALTSYKRVDAEPYEGEMVYVANVLGQELDVVTLPGTFSYGRLDEGTAFLLDHLGSIEFARALDFGCGSGVIGAALQLARPRGRVELVDSNIMALASSRRTLERNGLDPTAVQASDVLSAVRDDFDLIVTNPPFHTGLQTDFHTTRKVIQTAGQYLSRHGRLVMVANAFIDYLQYLRPVFEHVRIVAESPRFRVIEAGKPRHPHDK